MTVPKTDAGREARALKARADRLADHARRRESLRLIPGQGLPPTPSDRFAGADADRLVDADSSIEEQARLFALEGYGGRRCTLCGSELTDSTRADARFCSDACRARQWRRSRRDLWKVGGDG